MTHPFITHNGGPCPVSPEARVDVKFRSGLEMENYGAKMWSAINNRWQDDWWQWQGDPMDNIIAYRLHQPTTDGETS